MKNFNSVDEDVFCTQREVIIVLRRDISLVIKCSINCFLFMLLIKVLVYGHINQYRLRKRAKNGT